MKKYFKTDGIRGKFDLIFSEEFCFKFGLVLSELLNDEFVIIGRDTRYSSEFIEKNIEKGIIYGGKNVKKAGVINTPGLAFLTKHYDAKFGIMITASHNDYLDNGIKMFSSNGEKLNKDDEMLIEKKLNEKLELKGNSSSVELEPYLNSLLKIKSDLRIGFDLSNGALSDIAKIVFKDLNATYINDNPNGKNINDLCGSTHPFSIKYLVEKKKLDIGFSYDGDGDRLIICSDKKIFDGNHILYLLSEYYNSDIVTTHVANQGVSGIKNSVVFTDIGDKYISRKMKELNIKIGGEPSGHIMLSEYGYSSDGMLITLLILKILSEKKTTMKELLKGYKEYEEINTKVMIKKSFDQNKLIELNNYYNKLLENSGKVLIRKSGTEDVVRIHIQYSDEALIEELNSEMYEKVFSLVGDSN